MDTTVRFPGQCCAPERDEAKAKRAKLEDLVPIAFVIAGGCDSCAERMVRRAMDQGSSRRDIARTLRIVEHLRKQDCVAEKIGEGVLSRMDAPLARARQTLDEVASSQTKTEEDGRDCGC